MHGGEGGKGGKGGGEGANNEFMKGPVANVLARLEYSQLTYQPKCPVKIWAYQIINKTYFP